MTQNLPKKVKNSAGRDIYHGDGVNGVCVHIGICMEGCNADIL